MGRFAKGSGEGGFQEPPVGNHVARCIKLTDLGTQQGEYQGKPRARNIVMLTWELCNEKMQDDRPFAISHFYTNSLNEKATLRHHLEAWRGRTFTDQELDGFDLQAVLGKPCMLSVVLNEAGKARVSAVAAMPKGMAAPEAVNKCEAFWIDEWDEHAFAQLSDGVRRIIEASDEYKAMRAANGKPKGAAPSIMELEEDIPF